MEKVCITSSDGASAEMTLHGAHLCSWIPAGGAEQLFLSKTSAFQEGTAIRGGVPIIFPQFANEGHLPKHGFARTAKWQCSASGHHADGTAYAEFIFNANAETLSLWPHIFQLTYQVSVGANRLVLSLQVRNNGATKFSFTTALHTYCKVNDVHQTQIHGLGGLPYRDALQAQKMARQELAVLSINGEVDRVYANAKQTIVLEESCHQIEISQSGFKDSVIWNPGKDKTLQLSDLEPNGYLHMLCVEAAAVMHAISLAPGETWYGTQTIVLIKK